MTAIMSANTYTNALKDLRAQIKSEKRYGARGTTVYNDDKAILGRLERWCLDRDYLVRHRYGRMDSFEIQWDY